MDIDYYEVRNFNIIESGDEEDAREFSMKNPDFLEWHLEDSDGVSSAPVASVTIDLILPNDQFYALCSQLNEDQQHLLSFTMQYAVHCKLAGKNNELQPKPFQLFLSGGAGVGKFFSHCNNRALNPSRPNPGQREKIRLNFCFHTSFWCLKSFYEGLKDLHETF